MAFAGKRKRGGKPSRGKGATYRVNKTDEPKFIPAFFRLSKAGVLLPFVRPSEVSRYPIVVAYGPTIASIMDSPVIRQRIEAAAADIVSAQFTARKLKL
jgi:hypothetical protein